MEEQAEKIENLMSNGRNAKEELFKLHSMMEDYHNQTRKDESLIFNEQLNNSVSYFSQDIGHELRKNYVHNMKLDGTGKMHFKLGNKEDLREDEDDVQALCCDDIGCGD